jgi:hypothetical protein
MKKYLLATAALLLLSASSVMAATITFQVREDGGGFTTIPTPNSFSTVGPVSFGDFLVSGTGATQGSAVAPLLLSAQTIDFQTSATGSHTLDFNVLGVGITSPTGLSNLLSHFDATALSSGWSASISTDINGTIINTGNFTGPLSGGSDFAFNGFTLPSTPFSASVDFHVVTNGPGGANLGGALAASAVPGPIVGAGIPGFIALLGMLGLNRFRKRRHGDQVAVA